MSGTASSVLVTGHHGHYVSQSGLVGILKHVRQHGIPEHFSRRTVKRAREAALPAMTPLGPLWGEVEVEMIKGPNKKFPLVNPMALLWYLTTECSGFSKVFKEALHNHPCSIDRKWHVAIYNDEILPGNALKASNERKLLAFYWTVTEFGERCSDEDYWLHIISVRTSEVKLMKSGVAQLFKKVVEAFFVHPYSINNGVQLRVGDESVMWFGQMAIIIGDEVALKQSLSFKGAAGTVPCPLCRNVTQWSSGLANHDPTSRLIFHTEIETGKMILHSANSIAEAVTLLKHQKGVLSKSAFETLEQSLGLSYQPEGALYCPQFHSRFEFGPLASLQFDWMHCYLVGGSMNHEIGYLMESLASYPFSFLATEISESFEFLSFQQVLG